MTEFLRDEAGMASADWVGAASGVLLVGAMIVFGLFNGGTREMVEDVNSTLVFIDEQTGAEEGSDVDPARIGNASPENCKSTGKYIVCIGPE